MNTPHLLVLDNALFQHMDPALSYVDTAQEPYRLLVNGRRAPVSPGNPLQCIRNSGDEIIGIQFDRETYLELQRHLPAENLLCRVEQEECPRDQIPTYTIYQVLKSDITLTTPVANTPDGFLPVFTADHHLSP